MQERGHGGLRLPSRQGGRDGAIGKGMDAAGYDPASGNAFASNADATLTVIHQESPDTYRVMQTVATAQRSRNMGLDPSNHRIYVPAAKFGQSPGGKGRRPVLPGSFEVLVIARGDKQ